MASWAKQFSVSLIKHQNITNMQFKLIVNGNGLRKHDIDILRKAVFDLQDNADSYFILEPKLPINNSIYIQAVRQADSYIAEMRFVFDSDGSFRHYSKEYTSQEDLFTVFSAYYSNQQVPDITDWVDDTASLAEDEGNSMIKLYKTIKGVVYYFEAWINDDNSLTIHRGMLGDIGETDEFTDNLPPLVTLAKLVEDKKEAGYTDDITHAELILQYTYNETDATAALLQKQTKVEALLNNALGWTGNGHCEGTAIQDGKMNVICYVIDKDIALDSILSDFVEDNLLEGLRIGYADEFNEEYILLYPTEGSFVL
ncbi:MAG: hypothetical protein RL662_2112 [Bacteroidota bacterium]|jgi:hypothetical protein